MNEPLPQERPFYPMKGVKPNSEASRDQLADAAPVSRSFEDFFTEHWAPVYRVLLRLVGDPQEAEDLALETFLRYSQQPPKQNEEFNPVGWLYRVATNLGLHSIRSHKRRERYELAAGKGALEIASKEGPAEILSGDEERRLARLALTQMNPRQAELLVLRYSGMAYKEIAAQLHLSPSSIGPLLLRAEREFEKRCRALFQEEV
jgi:RNA polymerase sigma factor (sigma-70 family)